MINSILHGYIIGQSDIKFSQNEPYVSIIKPVTYWFAHQGCQISVKLVEMYQEYVLDLSKMKSVDMSDELYMYIINKLLLDVLKQEFINYLNSSYSDNFSWNKYKIESNKTSNIFCQWVSKYFEIEIHLNSIKIINVKSILQLNPLSKINFKIQINNWMVYINDDAPTQIVQSKLADHISLKKTLINYADSYIKKIIWYIILGHTNYYFNTFVEGIITKNIFEPYGIIFNNNSSIDDENLVEYQYQPNTNTKLDEIILHNTSILVAAISNTAYEMSSRYNSFVFNTDYGIKSDYLPNAIIDDLDKRFNIKATYVHEKYTEAINIIFESMVDDNYVIPDSLIFDQN
jgi:hypothetical protein